MNTSELIFIGIKGSVIALNRSTGNQVWATRLQSNEFVNVVLEVNNLFATTHGEIYCLNALTGKIHWHNPLKGYGWGLATIAISTGTGNAPALIAEKNRRNQQAASSGSAVAVIASS